MNSAKWFLNVAFLVMFVGCTQSDVLSVNQDQPSVSSDVDNDGIPDEYDCEPMNSDVFPGADDVCDGIDNDCDGDMDENGGIVFYADVDEDGYGDSNNAIFACAAPTSFVEVDGDCRDNDADSHPGADELCDGIDNDCDGEVPSDETDTDGDRYVGCEVWIGNDQDIDDGSDCDEARNDVHPNAEELCDGPEPNVDFNCDQSLATQDNDNDGYRSCEECDDSSDIRFPGNPEICDGVDNDCLDGIPIDEADTDADSFRICDNDCNDIDDTVYPGAIELCDQLDNNCDLNVPANEADDDSDRYVECTSWTGSNPDIDGGDDCDDGEVNNYPGNTEICDNIDNDCDGDIDDDDNVVTGTTDWYLDDDGDTYGNGAAVLACIAPTGHVDNSDDCDDSSDQRFPGNPEICDQLDNDCDLNVPANEADDDSDGYVECSDWVGTNVSINGGDDCDDTTNAITDVFVTWFMDSDGDGYAVHYDSQDACPGDHDLNYIDADIDGNGTLDIDEDRDCDDSRSIVCPGCAEELYTIWDDNCDGVAHGDGTTAYPSNDGDVYFTASNMIANMAADADFEAATVQDWDVYASDEGYTNLDISITSTTWSGAYLPAGDYSRYDVLLASVLRGTDKECSRLGPFTLSIGQQYSFAFVFQNDNTLDVNAISVATQTDYDLGLPALDSYGIPVSSEAAMVSTFVATTESEFIVICHGNMGSNGVGGVGGAGGGWTHVWFGESTF